MDISASNRDQHRTVEAKAEVVGPKCRDRNHHQKDLHHDDLAARAMTERDQEEDLYPLKAMDINVNMMANVQLDSVAMDMVFARAQDRTVDPEVRVEVVVLKCQDLSHHRRDRVPNALDQGAEAMMERDPVDLCHPKVMDMNANTTPSAHLDSLAMDMEFVRDQDPGRTVAVRVEVVDPKCRDPNRHRKDHHHLKDQAAGVTMERDLEEDLYPLKVMDINVNTMANVHLDLVVMDMVSVRDHGPTVDPEVRVEVVALDDRDRNHHQKDHHPKGQAAGVTMERDLEDPGQLNTF